jgi:hypothetical protein
MCDYLIDNDERLGGPINILRLSRWYGSNNLHIQDFSGLRNVLSGIGTFESQNADANVIEQLSQYYLVSIHKPNEKGETGLGFRGSINYRLDEYANVILDKSVQINEETRKIINGLRQGLSKSITIVIAIDTTINKGLIVDANKRATALYYFKHKEQATFEKLLNSKYHITVVQMKSPVFRIIYPLDFMNLCS